MVQGVTYLDQLPTELPELSNLSYNEGNMGMGFGQIPQPGPVHSPERSGDYSKYIRNSHNTPSSPYGSPPSHSVPTYDGYMGSGADMSGPGGYLQPPPQMARPVSAANDDYDFDPPSTSADDPKEKSCTCRDVFDHVNGCNICKAFYMEGRNNFMLYLIIVVLLLIIVFLITKVYDIHLKRPK